MESEGSLTHHWHDRGRTVTFTWLGDADVVASRVYAFAFTQDGRMLLVGGGLGDSEYWLPGGGVERGETAEEALARELQEEAAAKVERMEPIGVQHVEDDGGLSYYHRFYWCHVTLLEPYTPLHEVAERNLVDPSGFLDALFWGRTDPRAELLLRRSQELERSYRESEDALTAQVGRDRPTH